MTVNDGEKVNAAISNAAWVSKEATTGNNVTGIVTLKNTTDVNSGAQIDNAQEAINNNTDEIAINAADIATNAADIATNAGDISDTITALGNPNADNMGTWTDPNAILTPNTSAKVNIQELLTFVDSLPSGLTFEALWDANANSPALASSPGASEAGKYWIVSTAGTTNLDGITDWGIGDWAIVNSAGVFQKIDNSDNVTSVFSRTGAVTAQANDYTWAQIDKTTSSIDDIADVDVSTVPPTDGQALIWDNGNSEWIAGDVATEGSGLKNFFSAANSKMEVDVIGDTDWYAFDDGSVTVPVDGVQAAATNVSIALDSVTPIEGTKSLEITKAGVNSQGEGVSVDSNAIDLLYQGEIAYASVGLDFTDANYAGTWGVWMYDVTNTVLINILEAGNFIPAGFFGTYNFSFLAPSGCDDLRFILMETDTNTDAMTLKLDVLKAGPNTLNVTIPYTRSEVIDVTGSGSFTGGTIQVERVNNQVTISNLSLLTHASSSNVSSAVGLIPDWALPQFISFNSSYSDGSIFTTCSVSTSGVLNTIYGAAALNSGSITLSYTVADDGLTIQGAVNNSQLETLSATSDVKTPSASANWNAHTNNSVVLKAGRIYDLYAHANFSNSGTPAYTTMAVGVFASNGTDTVAVPTFISAATGLQELSANGAGNYQFIPSTLAGTQINADVTRVRVLQDTTVYVVTYATMTTAGDSRITAYLNAYEFPVSQTAIVQQNKVAVIKDEKASGASGGTFTSGAWQIRTLNTLDDPFGLVKSLSSNQFTLGKGKYNILANGDARLVDNHQLRLHNVTTATTEIVGMNSRSASGGSTDSPALLVGNISIGSDSVFELQHRCQTTGIYGIANSFGFNEIYSQITITKTGE